MDIMEVHKDGNYIMADVNGILRVIKVYASQVKRYIERDEDYAIVLYPTLECHLKQR